GDLVHASPDRGRRPLPPRGMFRTHRPDVFDRSSFSPLAPRFERLGMLEAPHAIFGGPVLRGRDPRPSRPGIERRKLNAVSVLVRFPAIESRSLELDPTKLARGKPGQGKDDSGGDHAEAGMSRI